MKNLFAPRATVAPARGQSLGAQAWARLRQNRSAVFSIRVLYGMILLVCLGPWLSPYDVAEVDFKHISVPPNVADWHFFGTDAVGRDLYVRTLQGGRLSLAIGLVATLVSLTIGVTYGAIAGYLGGRVDAVMMRWVDILYALPFMFLVIVLMVAFGRHIILIFVAIGAINWLDLARIVRGQTLALKHQEFIEAAKICGAGPLRIISRHIVPNLLGIVVVYVTLTIPQAILVESFLSFLGLGVQEPATSWGTLVNEGAQEMESAPWTLGFPALFLVTALFCFNFIGDGLRDALDPKDR